MLHVKHFSASGQILRRFLFSHLPPRLSTFFPLLNFRPDRICDPLDQIDLKKYKKNTFWRDPQLFLLLHPFASPFSPSSLLLFLPPLLLLFLLLKQSRPYFLHQDLQKMGGVAVTNTGPVVGETKLLAKANIRPLFFCAIAVWGAILYGYDGWVSEISCSGSHREIAYAGSFVSFLLGIAYWLLKRLSSSCLLFRTYFAGILAMPRFLEGERDRDDRELLWENVCTTLASRPLIYDWIILPFRSFFSLLSLPFLFFFLSSFL